MFKRAASSMGSAASSFSKGITGIFKSKDRSAADVPKTKTTWKRKEKPLDADFHVTLAGVQQQSGNLEGAEEQYQKALELERDFLPALLGYGRLYDKQQRYNEALRFYKLATEKHPQHPAAWNDLGLCYDHLNRLPESVAALEKAVSLEPTRKLYRNNLASVLVKMKRSDEAFQQLAAVHPRAIAKYNVGYLLMQQDDRQLAYRYFSDAMVTDPNLKQAREWRDLLAPSLAGLPPSSRRPSLDGPDRVAPPPAAPAPQPQAVVPYRPLPDRAASPTAERPREVPVTQPREVPVAQPIRQNPQAQFRRTEPPTVAKVEPAAAAVSVEADPLDIPQSDDPTEPPLPSGVDKSDLALAPSDPFRRRDPIRSERPRATTCRRK
jgi:Tfp pilus assembly protein PilF